MPSINFDQRLIKKTRLNSLPTWTQLKYLRSFLTKIEKITINISLIIFFLTTITWSTVWFF